MVRRPELGYEAVCSIPRSECRVPVTLRLINSLLIKVLRNHLNWSCPQFLLQVRDLCAQLLGQPVPRGQLVSVSLFQQLDVLLPLLEVFSFPALCSLGTITEMAGADATDSYLGR